jgi:hypothetical protein
MGCEKAGLMNTDPPNGIDYNSAELHEHGVTYAKIANDQHKNQDLQKFLESVFATACRLCCHSLDRFGVERALWLCRRAAKPRPITEC